MNVIVYDLSGDTGRVYRVAQPLVDRLVIGAGMSLDDALAQLGAQFLPAGAANLVYTTDDQLPTLGQAKAAKVAELYAACQTAMTAGYVSSALGTPHTYPSTVIDQMNMTVSVVASLLPGLAAGWTTEFWCMAQDGAWSLAQHTGAQIQAAGDDGKAFITTQRNRLKSLAATVYGAADTASVHAVAW